MSLRSGLSRSIEVGADIELHTYSTVSMDFFGPFIHVYFSASMLLNTHTTTLSISNSVIVINDMDIHKLLCYRIKYSA